MSREIKFKAWDAEKKLMFDPNNESQTFGWYASGKEPNVTLLQFTGLKDKNGVEIYEGDLLINPKDTGSDAIARRVEWCNRSSKFTAPLIKKHWTYGFSEISLGQVVDPRYTIKYEVIGNIYENPDLLK